VKYAVVTFGCRVNQADSLAIEDQLRRRGAVSAPPEHADTVIINTCSVTAGADQGARQAVRRIVRSNPNVKVVVTGCYATHRPEDVRDLPNVVQVVANAQKESLVAGLDAAVEWTTAERFSQGDGPCGMSLEPGVAGRTALTLRVQTGCDEVCSYCIIPRTRGAGRSRPLPEVIREIRLAVDAGYREIAITGVHLGSYGRDLDDRTTFSRLVRILSEWPDDVLFRISSLEPMDCTPDIVEAAAGSPRLAPHFHLPLQHGSDVVLQAMRRPYSSVYYRRLVELIRARIPHAAIGTDLIVGFPGETADDFRILRELLPALPVTHLHVFPYSDRPGTAASRLVDKVDGAEIRARAREVRAIGEGKSAAFRVSQQGQTLRGLVVDDGLTVVTGNYLKVRTTQRRDRNSWVRVRVDRADPLVGSVLPE
jgi:threonylcarbamoyladenosine tRNA methylthiotransferase MtaB